MPELQDQKRHLQVRKECDQEDLPVEASFQSDSQQIFVKVLETLEKMGLNGKVERIRNSGFTCHFKGHAYSTKSTRVTKLLLASKAYAQSKIWPDPADPSGFWRQQGVMEGETVTVNRLAKITFPKDGFKIKKVEKPEEPVEPFVNRSIEDIRRG